MADPPREALVILDAGPTALEGLRAAATVTQLLPPRLALAVRRPGAGADVPGVRWFDDDVPDDELAGLTEPERLFVAAWRSRRAPKERQADGLSWDAPGRTPPDKPVPGG